MDHCISPKAALLFSLLSQPLHWLEDTWDCESRAQIRTLLRNREMKYKSIVDRCLIQRLLVSHDEQRWI